MDELELLIQTYMDMGVPEEEAITQAKFDIDHKLTAVKFSQVELGLDEDEV